jgi:Undecaprenyl-phosphate glucose phosphotransferase
MIKLREKTYIGLLFIANSVIIILTLFLSYYLRFRFLSAIKGVPPLSEYFLFFILAYITHNIIFYLQSYFRFKLKKGVLDTLFELLFNYISTIAIVLGFFSYLRSYKFIGYEISHKFLIVYFVIGILSLLLTERGFRHILKKSFKSPKNRRKGIIIGCNETGEKLAVKLLKYRDWGIDIIGFLDDKKHDNEIEGECKIIGKISDLEEILIKYSIKDVFITITLKDYDLMLEIIRMANKHLAEIKIVPDIIHLLSIKAELEHIDDIPIINLNDIPLKGWKAISKRVIDLTFSFLGLIFLSPALLMVAFIIKLSSKGPIFYLQERVGIDGKRFNIIKFRTMIQNAEAKKGPVWSPTKDDPRITKIGRFLRKYSIDEFPQLINVLRGDMSLVGPRPERPIFVEKFKRDLPQYMLRHKVKAGMTGWAQVHGLRGNTSLGERLKYDLYYIENWSVKLDFKIIWMTFLKLGFIDPNLR